MKKLQQINPIKIPTVGDMNEIYNSNKLNKVIKQLNRLTKIVNSRESMKEDTVYENKR